MRLTGPVEVAGWPDAITPENVVEVTLHQAYVRFPDARRITFLADVARAVWVRLLTTDVPVRRDALAEVGRAVRARRLLFHLRRPQEQRALEALGADGALRGSIALVTQNAAGHKMDLWLRRRLDVALRLRPDGSADVRAWVTLANGGPSSG